MGKQVFCDICNCYIPSAALVPGHKEGRKHQRLAQRRKQREHSDICSIYVRGFPKSATIEHDLDNILKVYGPIHGLYLDKSNLSYAIVQYKDEESAKKVLSIKEDLMIGGMKLLIKPRKVNKQEKSNRDDSEEHSKVKDTGDMQKKEKHVLDNILLSLQEENTLDDQMKKLLLLSSLSCSDLEMRELIRALLTEVFVEAFPDAKIVMFGSSACGVGVQGSDLDLTLITDCLAPYKFRGPYSVDSSATLGFPLLNDEKYVEKDPSHKLTSDICNENESPGNQIKQNVKIGVLDQLDPADVPVNLAKQGKPESKDSCSNAEVPLPTSSCVSNTSTDQSTLVVDDGITNVTDILRKFAPGCKNVFPLKSARCPVIHFSHTDSSLQVDLSINNRLAVENTRLLRRYIDIDGRVKQLIYTIRAWARSKGLYGKGGKQLTGYALTLMIIHFLQHCNPPVLPCLQDSDVAGMDTIKGGSTSNVILGWECYFSKPVNWVSSNTQTPGQLLLAFFDFYKDFNFTDEVVTIRCLRKVLKTSLSSDFSPSGLSGFKVTAVCVQDPFELNHNVGQNLSSPGLDYLKEQFLTAHAICLRILSREMAPEGISVPEKHDLRTLLEPIKKGNVHHSGRKKRLAVKYNFDVRSDAKVSCSLCAKMAFEILQIELRMQCDWSQKMKANRDDLSTEVADTCTSGGDTATQREATNGKRGKRKIPFESDCTDTVDVVDSTLPTTKRTKTAHLIASGEDGSIDGNEKDVSEAYLKDDKSFADDLSLPYFDEASDAIEIVAKAWANTWVKRRQQRRLLQAKSSAEIPAKSVSDEADKHSECLSLQSTTSTHDFVSSTTAMSVDGSSDPSLVEEDLSNSKLIEGRPDLSSSSHSGILSISVKVADIRDKNADLSTRVVVKVLDARDLNIFHTFYAFFKKRLLTKLGLKSDSIVESMRR